MKNKKILVTAGGTEEFIDDVRVLTNISTGKLGALIAQKLIEAGAQVYFLRSRNSKSPVDAWLYRVARTANDAMEAMKEVIIKEKIDAVVHAMAVSDFTFKRDPNHPIKCKSGDPQAFIEYMRQTITMYPKIISMIKQWRPETILVGFKFESGSTSEEIINLALTSIRKNGCDLVVANDKKEMELRKEHVARLVFSPKWGGRIEHACGKEDIANKILEFLTGGLNGFKKTND